MTVFVSLLRAINLGSHQKIGMGELKALHERAGLKNVRTLLQTGNVVFESDAKDGEILRQNIENEIERTFAFRTDVMIRTAAELSDIMKSNPFAAQAREAPNWLIVMFLLKEPEATAQQALGEKYRGPEQFKFFRNNAYIVYPNGIGRSKLTNAIMEKSLGTRGTGRNWTTVTRLLAMATGCAR